MKVLTVVLGLVLSLSTNAFALDRFPTSPQPSLTPGSLCSKASAYRYPEKVPYCNRDVDGTVKDEVVKRYDATFGYQVGRIGRHNFKIDHYIPLCMGGGNDAKNLWPQHPSVYAITDPLEPVLCQKMADGLLKQAEAIRLIKEAKADLSKVGQILDSVQAL